MAIIRWIGGGNVNNPTSGNWNNASRWNGDAVPTSSDSVTLGGQSGSTAYTVTLETASSANTLTLNDAGAGATLNLNAQTLTVGSTVSFAAGNLIDGKGTLSVGSSITGTGTIEATTGKLDVDGAVTSSSILLEIANASSNTLEIDQSVVSGTSVSFAGGAGTLDLTSSSISGNELGGFAGTIAGLTVSSNTTPTNDIDLANIALGNVTNVSLNTTSDVLTVSTTGGTFTLQLSGTYTGDRANWKTDGSSGTLVYLSTAACYLAGTRILTPEGEVAVGDLAIGDRVMTLCGEAKRIKWIGTRAYDPRFVGGNRNVLPIRIKRGALGGDLPRRDLFVSPEHALFIDGMLLPARALVNGVSVVQEWGGEMIEYYHVELAEHDVIYAEGAPAETYIDCDNRGMFQNEAEFAALYPEDEPRPWAYCAPKVDSGPELDRVRRQIAEHAGALAEDTLWRKGGGPAAVASSGNATPAKVVRLTAA